MFPYVKKNPQNLSPKHICAAMSNGLTDGLGWRALCAAFIRDNEGGGRCGEAIGADKRQINLCAARQEVVYPSGVTDYRIIPRICSFKAGSERWIFFFTANFCRGE